MNASPVEVDVLLVGMGPVGAALANLLGRHGVRVFVVDQARTIFEKPRAIALDNEALRILQWVGIQDGDLQTVAIPQVQYHSPLFGCFAKVNTAGIIDGHPMLVTFYQPELEQMLRQKVATYPSVQVRLGVGLVDFTEHDEGVTAQLRDDQGADITVACRYLVGADGATSTVRRKLGLEFEGETFEQDWLIVDAKNVPNPIDHCEFICNPRRPTPHMVAPGNRQRWEFMLHPGEDRQAMERPEAIRALLAPWCNMDQIEVERTAVYRFHAREARAFSKGRCFLIGDAAHITPPFAGQGLVAGLRDVANLGWKLAAVVQGKADARILASYDQERRPHAKKIIKLAKFLGNLVMPSSSVKAFFVHGAMRALRAIPPARAYFEDLKIKPDNTFDEGLFVREREHRKLLAGSSFPQGWVRPAGAAAPLLSDDVLGQRWAVIGFAHHPADHADARLLQQWVQAGGQVWQWCQRSQALHLGPSDQRVECLDETFMPRQVPLGWACIVRPDLCVYAEGPVGQVNGLLSRALQDGFIRGAWV